MTIVLCSPCLTEEHAAFILKESMMTSEVQTSDTFIFSRIFIWSSWYVRRTGYSVDANLQAIKCCTLQRPWQNWYKLHQSCLTVLSILALDNLFALVEN
jgi:hypothetical protein